METYAELIAALRSKKRELAEPASRRLRVAAEDDASGLSAHRKQLMRFAMDSEDLRVRWNLIIVLGKLELSGRQRAAAVDWLFERLRDESPLTRTFALQALVDLCRQDVRLRIRLLPIGQEFAQNGTAAMRARARKLLKVIESKA